MNRLWRVGGPVHRVVCLLLAVVLAGQLLVLADGTARADNSKIGVTPEDGWVNVRSGPGTGYSSLKTLDPGTTVTVVDEAQDSNSVVWYKIPVDSTYGYVRNDLITIMKATYDAKSGVSPSDDTLNVRSAPGAGETLMGTLAQNTAVSVVGEAEAADGSLWYRIVYGNGHGFVHSKYVTLTAEPTPTPTPTPTATPDPTPTPSNPGTVDPTPTPSDSGTVDPTPTPSDAGTVDPTPTPGDPGPVDPTPTPDVTPDPTPTPTPTPDPKEQFIAYLTEQGFPESYHESLLALHEQYPNWVFKAHLTGLDWNASVDAEAEIPKSLVEPYWPSSWKMVSDEAYNWETGEWYGFDGRWVAASREVIAYYMDPRNFLTKNSVFQFLDQRYDPEVQTLDGVKQIIKGTFMEKDVVDTDGKTLNYATAIYNAGKTYGVNPYVLASMIRIEQGVNGSALCSGTTPGFVGYFNFYNIGAYQQGNLSAVTTGLTYAKGGSNGTGTSNGRPWNSRLRSINGGAMYYASNFVQNNKSTFYLKRFNVVNEPYYQWQYSTAIYGAKIEGDAMASGYSEELREAALTFYIPVYEGMPETPPIRPTGDGSPNMKLSSLSVSGYELTPGFDDDTLEYSLVVPAHVQKLTINAKTMDSKATVAGAGTVELTEVVNTFEVVVTAENGSQRTYTVVIAKENSGIEGVEFSVKYTPIELCIPFAPGVLTADFIEQAMVSGSVTVVKADGTEKEADSTLSSGDVIRVCNDEGEEYGVFTAAMLGDSNGDGTLTINDIIKIRNHLLGTSALTGANKVACDTNRDGKYSINDMIILRNHILGTATIS